MTVIRPLIIKAIKKAEPKPKDEPKKGPFADLLAILAQHNPAGDHSEKTVKKGHHVTFKAGDFTGSGKVKSTGKDGLNCEDESGRDHRVHWHEVTGHMTEKPKNAKK